jgi:hypothetical protein
MTNQLSEAENGSSTMMINVEKLQRFLLEKQKHGIHQLGVLCQIIQLKHEISNHIRERHLGRVGDT